VSNYANLTPRLGAIAQWLQREDDVLLYPSHDLPSPSPRLERSLHDLQEAFLRFGQSGVTAAAAAAAFAAGLSAMPQNDERPWLQIASKGRVTREERARLPDAWQTVADAEILAMAQQIEAAWLQRSPLTRPRHQPSGTAG
jgi:hypothetical protein